MLRNSMIAFEKGFHKISSGGSAGAGSLTYYDHFEIEKTSLMLQWMPINKKLSDIVSLNFGLQYKYMIKEKTNGEYSYPVRKYDNPNISYYYIIVKEIYNNDSIGVNKKHHVSIVLQVTINLVKRKNLIIQPVYSYIFGVSTEFDLHYSGFGGNVHQIGLKYYFF